MPILEVRHVSKTYPGLLTLSDVSFEVAEQEVVCLLGPSGCGKTTLLRIIAGLEAADAGEVWFAGRNVADVPVHQRSFGLMFQDFALFPHKNVYDNVAFGLRMSRLPEAAVRTRVEEVVELVGLVGFEGRDVNELSGGEQQRVALARSLAPRPRLLMLDEPLGSLDRTLRERLMNELRVILKEIGVTALYVTHDQEEAFAIADRVIIMNEGRRVQEGTPDAVYCHPATPFVARFLGLTNLLAGKVSATGPTLTVNTALGPLTLNGTGVRETQPGQAVTVLIRPEAATLLPASGSSVAGNVVEGLVTDFSFRGGYYHLALRAAQGPELTFAVESLGVPSTRPGQTVRLALRPEAITLLPMPVGGDASETG